MSPPYYADVYSKFPPILSLLTHSRGAIILPTILPILPRRYSRFVSSFYGFVWVLYGNMESKCDISGLAPVQKLISKARHLRDRLWDQL